MLDRDAIFDFDPGRGSIESSGGIAALMGMAFTVFADCTRAATMRFEIRDVTSLLVIDSDKRGGKPGDLGLLGHHERDRLAAEPDLVVVERPEGRTRRRHFVAVLPVGGGQFRPMGVCKDIEHAWHCQRIGSVDAFYPASCDRRRDDKTVGQSVRLVFDGVFRRARDLGVPFDARRRFAEIVGDGHLSFRLPDTFVRLRLRCPVHRLRERAHDAAPRQFDFETILARAMCIAQNRVGCSRESVPRGGGPAQLFFGSAIAPWLVGNATERDACLFDNAAFDLESRCDREQCKGI